MAPFQSGYFNRTRRFEGCWQVTQWGTVFGDDVVAAALLDRMLHHSYTLFIQGDSYRLRQKKKAGLRVQAAATIGRA